LSLFADESSHDSERVTEPKDLLQDMGLYS